VPGGAARGAQIGLGRENGLRAENDGGWRGAGDGKQSMHVGRIG
jgi:hypothetical protein